MTEFSPDQIVELVCTRLSHDLIGNIGAVANAVELMEDDDSLSDVRPILETSARTLTARLKFFRLAFGLSNAAPANMADIEALAAHYLNTIGSRSAPISLQMEAQSPALYKMILLGVMALGDVFIRGGQIKVAEKSDGLVMTAASPAPLSTLKLEALQNVLQGQIPTDNPAQTAPLIYLQQLLHHAGVTLALVFDTNSAQLTIA